MTEKEYKEKNRELKEKIEALKTEYIRTNSPIKPGTKVKVTTNEKVEYGILSRYVCDFFDRVEPIIQKIKKDGTPSKVRIWVRWNSVVEVCNE